MRALTAEEIAQVAKPEGDDLTTITVSSPPPVPPPPPPLPLPPSPPPPPPPPSPPSPPPPPTCPANPVSTVNNAIIIQNEGGSLPNGYVPNDGIGVGANSGVTIAAGLDLSFWTPAQLQANFSISAADAAAFTPYAATVKPKVGVVRGIAGVAAQRLLSLNDGVAISQADADTISTNVIAYFTNRTASQFQTLAGQNFYNLPGSAQTALTDVVFNAGGLPATSLPSGFLPALEANNWAGVAAALQGSGNARLQSDGNIIAAAVAGGSLPANGSVCTP